MREVRIDEEIRRDRKLVTKVERATDQLEAVIGASADKVTVSWSIQTQPSGRSFEVEVAEGSAKCSTAFSEAELSEMSDSQLRRSWNWLWGDLLQERSHLQMARLNLIMQGLGEE